MNRKQGCVDIPFQCPDCGGIFSCNSEISNSKVCQGCGFTLEINEGVYNLFSSGDKEKKQKTGMNTVSSSPLIYSLLSALKTGFYKMQGIGVQEFIDGKKVLELGCGPSFKGSHLEHQPRNAKFYVGLDVFFPFLRQNRRQNTGSNFCFVQASVEKIPFPDDFFDTTVAFFVLHHIPCMGSKIFSEMRRVTRNHLVIFDHMSSMVPLIRRIQKLYWRTFDGGFRYLMKPEWEDLLAGWEKVRFNQSGPFGQVFKTILKKNEKDSQGRFLF